MLPQSENSPRTNEISDQKQHIAITLQIKVAFWWPYYVKTMVLFCRTFGTTPDPDKLKQMIHKAIRLVPPQSQKDKRLDDDPRRTNRHTPTPGGWSNLYSLCLSDRPPKLIFIRIK